MSYMGVRVSKYDLYELLKGECMDGQTKDTEIKHLRGLIYDCLRVVKKFPFPDPNEEKYIDILIPKCEKAINYRQHGVGK